MTQLRITTIEIHPGLDRKSLWTTGRFESRWSDDEPWLTVDTIHSELFDWCVLLDLLLVGGRRVGIEVVCEMTPQALRKWKEIFCDHNGTGLTSSTS